MAELQDQAIRQHCKALRIPTIGTQFARLAEAATREGQSHLGYLEALLAAEMEERESRAITRLLHEARLPRMKTLEAFEFDRSGVSAGQLRTLAEGDYIAKAEPVLLVGEAGTGKTHLATGLCVAACRQRRRVRFTTATAMINDLAEAAHANQLSRALGRWERLDLICIDELGYVPLAETACELMFQVIADRAEKAAVIVTTNLPFASQPIAFVRATLDRLIPALLMPNQEAFDIAEAAKLEFQQFASDWTSDEDVDLHEADVLRGFFDEQEFLQRQVREFAFPALFHAFERTLRKILLEADRLHCGAVLRTEKELFTFNGMLGVLARCGYQTEGHPFRPDLDKLNLISNAVKHGQGKALTQLADMFPELFLRREPDEVLVPEHLHYLTPELLSELATSVAAFWEAFPAQELIVAPPLQRL